MYFDLAIFNFLHGAAGRSDLLDILGIFLADVLPYVLGLSLVSFLFFKKYRTMVFLAIASGLLARFFIKTAIVLFYQRPRPYITLPGVSKLIWMPAFDAFQSFPSGHMLFFFAASTILYLFNKKWGIFFFACSAVIGVTRIFTGVHWPSDILAGALLGIAVGLAIHWFYKNRLGNRTTKNRTTSDVVQTGK